MPTKLTPDEVAERLRGLAGWRLQNGAIEKRFSFAGFPEAVAFVNRLVPGAEAADHHPDITISYRHVSLSYSTHSEGGITARDFEGARMADEVARTIQC
jgi:4a-hydroxytetrahydrobiopterin dehydratase